MEGTGREEKEIQGREENEIRKTIDGIKSMKRLTQYEFLLKAKSIHGDKYDFSKSVYKNRRTPVFVICPVHGGFWSRDILYGKGCMKCGQIETANKRRGNVSINNRTLKYGVGVNDYEKPIVDSEGKVIASYQIWVSMLSRCYSKKYQSHGASYIGCTVCDEWLSFSNFKEWFDSEESGYREGYQLDKDIIKKGNRNYSPQNCVFVPQKINSLFCSSKSTRGNLPIGVYKNKNRFYAHCSNFKEHGKQIYIGSYITEQDAFIAYKSFKENMIKGIAQSYYEKGLINKRAYDAMLRYKIKITD